ncbi:FAD-binding oxidoreductase [Candidatus Parcubacteria bacterium]|nr:MAG: FAD-binding oxidoreductase [Candidatus Parcubacteria bacterium]
MAESTWAEEKKTKTYPKLGEDMSTDVLIIGAGITGVLTAYLLAKEGKKVTLVDSGEIASGATMYTTAFITKVIDTGLSELVKMFEPEEIKKIWGSGEKAIDLIEEIIKTERIDCEFIRCPAYLYAAFEKQFEALEREEQAAKSLGFDVRLSRENDLNFNNHGYLEVKNQAKFHPLKFLYPLAERIEAMGVKIFERSEIANLSGRKIIEAETKDQKIIKAGKVIIATYDPFNKPRQAFLKKGMYVSYIMEVELPKGLIREAIYQDLHSPYYYFRIDPRENSDRMILGGADHRVELPISKEKNFKDLEEYLKGLLGEGVQYKMINKWRGPILEPADGIPLIGEYKGNHYLAAAFSGNGMTYSAVAAMIFRDLVSGRANEWADLYDPNRKRKLSRYYRKGLDYAKEFFGGAVKNTIKY